MRRNYLFHHGVTYAHTNEDIQKIVRAFDKGLDVVSQQAQ